MLTTEVMMSEVLIDALIRSHSRSNSYIICTRARVRFFIYFLVENVQKQAKGRKRERGKERLGVETENEMDEQKRYNEREMCSIEEDVPLLYCLC